MFDNRPDEALVSIARSGDEGAFEELFNRYKKPIINFIYRMIGNKETAEEVAVEVFMKAYNNLHIFDPNKRFNTWLFTIAKNLSKNAMRDRKYFRNVSLDQDIQLESGPVSLRDVIADPGSAPDDAIRTKELEREAQAILDSMPVKYREVVVLCSIQGMTYKEAAEVIGCSVASISTRMTEAKALFMKKIGLDDVESKTSEGL